MARISIHIGTRYLHNGTVFIVREVKQGDCFLVEDQNHGGQKTVSRQELLLAWTQGELAFDAHQPPTNTRPDLPSNSIHS